MKADFDPREFVRTLTRRPGVYRMLAASGEILYVGKARDLRRRVGSYFSRRALDAKTQTMLQSVSGIDVTITGTEQEALLLEYNLIKEHRPRFNVVLRDDKSYPYIHVTTRQPYPRFEFHRGSRSAPGRFFGPFPSAGAVRMTLQQLQKLFRVRPCSDSFFSNRSRPCLQYQIRRWVPASPGRKRTIGGTLRRDALIEGKYEWCPTSCSAWSAARMASSSRGGTVSRPVAEIHGCRNGSLRPVRLPISMRWGREGPVLRGGADDPRRPKTGTAAFSRGSRQGRSPKRYSRPSWHSTIWRSQRQAKFSSAAPLPTLRCWQPS